jgi:hypothetical protein
MNPKQYSHHEQQTAAKLSSTGQADKTPETKIVLLLDR